MKLSGFSARGGWWVIGQLLLLALILFAPGSDFGLSSSNRFRLHAAGSLLLFISAVVLVSGILELKGALTPYPKPLEGARLAKNGIYRLIRHPLYLGVMLASFGISLIKTSGAGCFLSFVLMIFLNAKSDREERWLSETYSGYDDYKLRTKKFFPYIY